MSNDQLDVVADQGPRTRGARPRRIRAAAMIGVATVGLTLAACGDDDDAADTVPGETLSEDSGVTATEPATTTAASPTVAATVPASEAPAGSEPPVIGVPVSTEPGTEGTAEAETAAASDAPTLSSPGGAGSDAPTGSEPAGTEPAGTGAPGDSAAPTGSASPSGPTTTGPECQFAENVEFPIQRCNGGEPVAAIQSVLQSLGYEVGTVDCLFGDQTLYAVLAFQGDGGLTADGLVAEDTWAAFADTFLPEWGNDDDGDGVVGPDEISFEGSDIQCFVPGAEAPATTS